MGEWHNLRNDRLRIEKKLRFNGCDNWGRVEMVSWCAIRECKIKLEVGRVK